MLLSMTGHGEANQQHGETTVAVEVRTVNSRYFKLSFRGGEGNGALEPSVESVVRRYVRRGTVQVSLRIDREPSPDDYRLNLQVLAGYRKQLEALCDELHLVESPHLDSLLGLPGVVDEHAARSVDLETDWPPVEKTLVAALENLGKMREDEGRAMGEDLRANRQTVADELTAIEARAPTVVESYRDRIGDRLKKLLAEHDVEADASDVLREVGLFAERSDISEEVVRLRSHLDQFDSIMQLPESSGRKLEFLTQEMFRETNTIGSKANDAEIARHVIDIKAAIERMREMIQNIE